MKKYNLLLIAHPDDETLFAAGLLQVYRRRPWRVVCVTDGNADGQHQVRLQEFSSALKELKVKDFEMWDFPDRYNARLNITELQAELAKETPSEVFTHGILGEYGHPHHQDVSLAAHRTFRPKHPVWSMAYNNFAEKYFRLPRKAYEKKTRILTQIYGGRTAQLMRWLPAHNLEGFSQVHVDEVEAIYKFLTEGAIPPVDSLKAYEWFRPYLETFRQQILTRPF